MSTRPARSEAAQMILFGAAPGLPALDWSRAPFRVLAEGMSKGAPEPLVEVIPSLLRDGDLVRITRYGNREVTLHVQMIGRDFADLSLLEADVAVRLDRRTELVWRGPHPEEPPTVYRVLTSSMVEVFDDVDEELRCRRTVVVTLTCLPFAYSQQRVSETLRDLSPPGTLFLDGSSASGWSAVNTADGSTAPVASSGGQVRVTEKITDVIDFGSGIRVGGATRVRLPGPLTIPNQPGSDYVTVLMSADAPVSSIGARLFLDGVKANDGQTGQPVEKEMTPTGQTRLKLLAKPGTYSRIDLEVSTQSFQATGTAPATRQYAIDEVRVTSSSEIATTRQFSRVADVQGSMRTEGTVIIDGAGQSLGDVLLHTTRNYDDGYRPDIMRWATPAPASNSTSPSGSSIVGTGVFHVPVRTLRPGAYQAVVFVRQNNAAAVNITCTFAARAAAGTTDLGRVETLTNPGPVALESARYLAVPLGTVSLPTLAAAEGSTDVLRVVCTVPPSSGGSVANIGELWLVRVDTDSDLTWVRAPAYSRVVIEQPGPEVPYGRVTAGVAANGADGRHPGPDLMRRGLHTIVPGGQTLVSCMTTNAPGASATLQHHPAGHTHAPVVQG